jgi:hypothetical protein
VFTSAGFGEVRTDPAWSAVHLTAVKP